MLSSSDWTQMAADMTAIRGDRDVSVAFRRGSTTLAAQSVRIAQRGGHGAWQMSGQAKESRGGVLIQGAVTLDVHVGDRFTDGGIVYAVVHIQPNRDAATVAEAEAVE